MDNETKSVLPEMVGLVSDLIKNLSAEVKTLSIDSARVQVQLADYVRRLEAIEKLIDSGSDGMHLLEAIKALKDEINDFSEFKTKTEKNEDIERDFRQKQKLVDREQRWKITIGIFLAIVGFISAAVIVWLKLKLGTP